MLTASDLFGCLDKLARQGLVDHLAFDCATNDPEDDQQHDGEEDDHAETGPVLADGVDALDTGQFGGEIRSHEADGQEEDGDFGQQHGDACETLDGLRVFQCDQVEVEEGERFLFRQTPVDFRETVQFDAVQQSFEAGCGRGAQRHAHGDIRGRTEAEVALEGLLASQVEHVCLAQGTAQGRGRFVCASFVAEETLALQDTPHDEVVALIDLLQHRESASEPVQFVHQVDLGFFHHVGSLD